MGVVVLASGGLDSAALIGEEARAGRDVFPLFLSCGMVWERAELAALRRFLKALPGPIARRVRPLKVAALPMKDLYGGHWSVTGNGVPGWRASDNSVYLPGRNIGLLAKGAVYAALMGVPRVAVGVLKGNSFPDASSRFLKSFERSLAQGLDFPVVLAAPFLKLHKEDVIRRASDLPLHLTLSCSSPRGAAGSPCLRCAKCRERVLAFGPDRGSGLRPSSRSSIA